MPALLAECTACGRPFPAGEIGDGGFTLGPAGSSVHIESMTISGGQVALEGAQVSCPRCGAMGHVPDGFYDIMQNGVAVFRRLSSAEAERIVELLVRLEREGALLRPRTSILLSKQCPRQQGASSLHF